MHLPCAEGLSCPRCGPAFPLILLATKVEDRRILAGALGCANCRERYPVRDGFADLRPEPRTPVGPAGLEKPTDAEVERAAALLGIGGSLELLGRQSPPVIAGVAARFAPPLAALFADHDLAVISDATAPWPEEPGLDRMTTGGEIPFADRSVRGVLLEGDDAERWVDAAIRVLAPGHRIAVLQPPEGLGRTLLARGLRVGEPDEGALVATR